MLNKRKRKNISKQRIQLEIPKLSTLYPNITEEQKKIILTYLICIKNWFKKEKLIYVRVLFGNPSAFVLRLISTDLQVATKKKLISIKIKESKMKNKENQQTLIKQAGYIEQLEQKIIEIKSKKKERKQMIEHMKIQIQEIGNQYSISMCMNKRQKLMIENMQLEEQNKQNEMKIIKMKEEEQNNRQREMIIEKMIAENKAHKQLIEILQLGINNQKQIIERVKEENKENKQLIEKVTAENKDYKQLIEILQSQNNISNLDRNYMLHTFTLLLSEIKEIYSIVDLLNRNNLSSFFNIVGESVREEYEKKIEKIREIAKIRYQFIK